MDIRVAKNVSAHAGGSPNSYELLVWLNKTLKTHLSNLEQVCTGAAFCQLMDWCFPGSLDLSKVHFLSKNNAESLINYDLLRAAFKKVGVTRYIPIETLVEKNTVVALAFLHWFKQFFDKNRTDRQYDPLEARGGQMMAPPGSECPSSLMPQQTPEMSEKKSQNCTAVEARNKEEAPSKEKQPGKDKAPSKEKTSGKEDVKENLNKNLDVIVLISDEDDIVDVTTLLKTEKMDTTESEKCVQPKEMKVVEQEGAAVVNGNQETSFLSSDTLSCFIRRFCSGSNSNTNANKDSHPSILSPTHPSDIIQACSQLPYSLYLYSRVELNKGRTTSVVLVGYFDQRLEMRVVRLLLTLQMSDDTPASTSESGTGSATRDGDAHLLLDTLKKAGLPLSNLAVFHCNIPNSKLSQEFVSQLQTVNTKFLSLCGLPGMAERACNAALLASFHPVVDLVKAIHQYHSTCSPSNPNLKHVFNDTGSFDPTDYTSIKCLHFIRSVQRMVANWRALLDYFKSERQAVEADKIRAKLMEHKVKLHFLFLSCALEPLRALQALQQQGTADVAVQLQLAAIVVNTFASSLLQPSDRQSFLKCRNLQFLLNESKQLPPSKLDIGTRAREFLWATAVVDLGEEERAEFLSNAATFFRVALESLVKSIPQQLGDMELRNISIILKHPEDPKNSKLHEDVLADIGSHLGLCEYGSEEHQQMIKDYFRVIKTAEEKQMNGAGKAQGWPKMMRSIQQYSLLHRFILTLLALPSSLQRNKVFADVLSHEKTVIKDTPKSQPRIFSTRPRVRRQRPGYSSYASRKKTDQRDGETSSEGEERPQNKPILEIPVKCNIKAEDSEYTDNSSDVVDITEDSKLCPTSRLGRDYDMVQGSEDTKTCPIKRQPNTGNMVDVKDSKKYPTKRAGQMTPVAETVYIVSDEDDKLMTTNNSSDPEDVGQLVWCVVDGFSTWPAIIISSKETLQPGKRMVWWYGQIMSTQVSEKDLKPFAAFGKHFCSNSFAVFVTYREAIFVSLQEAAMRCKKQFSADLTDKEEQLKQMLDWAFGGFLPTGPDGFKPTGATNGIMKKINQRPKVKKKLFLKADTSDHSTNSSPMSSRNSITEPKDRSDSFYKCGGSKTAEEDFDFPGQGSKGVMKEKKSKGGLLAGRSGWRGGKVQQKKNSPFHGFDNDMSPDFVPYKKRTLIKTYYKDQKTTSVYTQPDQKLREEIINKIMKMNLDIEGYCLCCATLEVEIFHPLFKGSLCTKCKDNLTETLYRYDEDGYQSYCTICCYGLEVILCGNNSCSRSYCTDCLNILVGPGTSDTLKEKDPWICFLCQPHKPHGALIPREDWSIRVQELFANNSAMEFEPHRVYPSIPADLRRPLRVLSLFDGIATGYCVLKELGFKVEKYVASEICEDSLLVAEANHGRKIFHVGDARSITEKQLQQWGPFDLLIGGSPCNDLSIVNPNRKGLFEGTGRLFFDYYRILQLLKPKEEDPRPFFWLFENVVFMNKIDKVNICRFLECNPVLVDAVNVSPAHRARCFWGNIPGMSRPIIASQNDKLTLQECLENGREARVDKVRTITTNRNSLKQGECLLPVLHNGREDILWITELEKIFGFPKHYTDVKDMNRQQRQKLLGKAWSVPVIRHLLAPLKDYFACEELLPMTTSVSFNSSTSPSSPASPDLQQLR
ncbi:uncharacterized protein LOC121517786 isoform X2 [Cheilinus undulatus]|uniref:uncharacterized protein LOC121517786 isoform X2 n=1 Tax=Cheilinus undulatus TaxID=241271 RepID=UPI001BD3E763|nr:uncharacterized protein LOC121517786 isoform X2 [Cheilinus undulatus]